MKNKPVLILAVFITLSFAAFGQKAFQKGNNNISAGIGFLGINWKGINYNLNYENAVSDKFGAGAHLGYSQYKKSGYTYTAFLIGAKASYHFLITPKTDPYAGAELGYVNISHTGQNNSTSVHAYSPVGIGVYGGVRYFFTPAAGIYGEIHLSTFSILGTGFCFKL